MARQIIGNVIHYDPKKGYGFILDDEGCSQFFHIREVQSLANGGKPIPQIGDLFRFTIEESPNKPGRYEARGLQLARRAQRPEAR